MKWNTEEQQAMAGVVNAINNLIVVLDARQKVASEDLDHVAGKQREPGRDTQLWDVIVMTMTMSGRLRDVLADIEKAKETVQ